MEAKRKDICAVIGKETIKGIVSSLYIAGKKENRVAKSDIDITITEPELYKGISTGIHIPYFAMSQERAFADNEGEITEFGIEKGRECLINLFHACKYFTDNLDEIKKRLAEGRDIEEQKRLFYTFFRGDMESYPSMDTLEQLIKRFASN